MSASKPKPSFNSGHGGSGGAQVQYDYNNNIYLREEQLFCKTFILQWRCYSVLDDMSFYVILSMFFSLF